MAETRAIFFSLAGAVACGGAVWAGLAMQSGCQLQGSCQQTTTYVPSIPSDVPVGEGVTAQAFLPEAGVHDGVWQSGSITGTWMNYPGSVTYVIYPQLPDGGPFLGPYNFSTPWVSPDPNPYTTSFALAAGNLAEVSGLSDGGLNGFTVTNDTCSGYYLWMQVTQLNPPGGDTPTTPAGGGADAGTADTD